MYIGIMWVRTIYTYCFYLMMKCCCYYNSILRAFQIRYTQFIKNSPISRILDPSLCQMASQYLFVYLEELFAEFCSKPWSPEKLRLARGSLHIFPNLSVCFLFCNSLSWHYFFSYADNLSPEFSWFHLSREELAS